MAALECRAYLQSWNYPVSDLRYYAVLVVYRGIRPGFCLCNRHTQLEKRVILMKINPPCTNHNTRSKIAALCLGISVFTASSAANAYAIMIEPDHYAEGTNLSTIAPYVTLQSHSGFGDRYPVYATKPRRDFDTPTGELYDAPTGELSFGNFSGSYVQCGDYRIECVEGFGMTFHQPVDWVSLKAINDIYGYSPEEAGNDIGIGLPAQWYAFDVNGDQLASGLESGVEGDNRGVVFEMYWDIPGMTSLVVGGFDSISAFQFDDLRFKLTQATVPEPGTLGLFGMGVAGLVAFRRRQRHPA